MGCPGQARREAFQEGTKKLWGDMCIIYIVVMVLWVHILYVKTYQTVHFKHVKFIVWQLYINKFVF